MHPNEDCIATGTASGKILLWYNYLASLSHNQIDEDDQMNGLSTNEAVKTQNKIKPTKTVLHWHSLPVLSLCFTVEGSFLLSGGHECVLVKWMFKSGQKEFKPRLGAPLNEIACANDNTLYAAHHLDNCEHFFFVLNNTHSVKVLYQFSFFFLKSI